MRVEHVALYVKDLEGAKAFFERNFSVSSSSLYHNDKTGFSSYFLSFDEGGSRLELMNRPDITLREISPLDQGFVHLALSLGSKEKVNTLTDKLVADGCKLLSGPRTTGDGYYESCLACFEGNIIELTV